MCLWGAAAQNTSLLPNGSFESGKPSFWDAEPGTSGATLTWATDAAKSPPRSLKIVKSTTGGMARWISKNNVRYWVTDIPRNVDIKVGAWVKTQGVNVNPTTNEARWQLKFWFYNAANQLIGGQPFVLNVDQSVATKDWYADTNAVGSLILPENAVRLLISAEAGANATGTVWFDNFIFVGRAGAWAGQNWNGFVDADEGWQYWIAPSGGNDGQTYFPGSGVTTEQARTGSYSLKVTAPAGRSSGELVWFTETVPIPANSAGKKYVLSAWVKTIDNRKDSVFNASYALGFTWTWHRQMFADAGGWNEHSSGEYRFVLNREAQDWTQYQVVITVPHNDVRAISVRPRAFPLWYGTAYYDDFELSPLSETNAVASMGSFESGKPSFWDAEPGTSGATLTWATDAAKSPPRSLKIVKSTTGGMARWISKNNVRYWVTDIPRNVDIKVGAWVKTQGVNVNPTTNEARWQLKFWFYNAANQLIGGQPFVLNVDQSVATKDWYADTNAVGSLILPENAVRLLISAEAGANATGTVWFDNFIFVGRAGAWAGQNWNGFVDADEGWQYWIAPSGGNDGQTYFPGSGVTTEQARTGSYSLKVTAPAGRSSGELVWFTETVPIPANSAGKKYVLSAWVKTIDNRKDSVFNASYALGFTWTWHRQMFADAGGWNEHSSGEYRFVLNREAQDWTQYQVVITVPHNDVRAISVRPRAFPLWYGTAYYDDFEVRAIEAVPTSVEQGPPVAAGAWVPTEFVLLQNYPNPFNPSTTIEYQLPVSSHVTLEVFNVIGQRITTLVDELQTAGAWTVRWSGLDAHSNPVATGLYLYRLKAGNTVLSKKMILMK